MSSDHFYDTVQNDTTFFFWRPPGFASQWTPSSFTIDGTTFNCAEQYMMWRKAALFNDVEVADKILRTTNPRVIKKLGREVRSFDQAVWDSTKYEILVTGNMAKFSIEPFRSLLLETGDKVLVEASPLDRIYGIGVDAETAMKGRKFWNGQNLLGQALMDVRASLRETTSR